MGRTGRSPRRAAVRPNEDGGVAMIILAAIGVFFTTLLFLVCLAVLSGFLDIEIESKE
jgi:hypothetical protein